MITSCSVVFLISLVLLPATVGAEGKQECITTLSELEKSLFRDSNMDSLKKAFFPTNRQASVAVEVCYSFITGDDDTNSNTTCDYKFRWTSASVHLFIRPALLERLSLYVHQVDTKLARLVIDPICGEDGIAQKSDSLCYNSECKSDETGNPICLLNTLTIHMKSYTLHHQVNEHTQGYSSYFFNPDQPKDYCIIAYETRYSINRTLITISLSCLLFFLAFTIPVTIKYIYGDLDRRATTQPSLKYFIWATVIGVTVIYISILAIDISTIVVRGFREKSALGDVFSYYKASLAALIIVPILDIFGLLLLMCISRDTGTFKEDFPTPQLIIFCTNCHNSIKIFRQYVATYFFTLWLQHISFHGFYVLLAFIASPLQTASLVAFYIAAAFFMISFIAVILKITDVERQDGERQDGDRLTWEKCKGCLKRLGQLLIVVIFFVFVSCFIAYFIETAVLVEAYRDSDALTVFIGSLAPSIVLSLLGYIGKKIVDTNTNEDRVRDGYEDIGTNPNEDRTENRREEYEDVDTKTNGDRTESAQERL